MSYLDYSNKVINTQNDYKKGDYVNEDCEINQYYLPHIEVEDYESDYYDDDTQYDFLLSKIKRLKKKYKKNKKKIKNLRKRLDTYEKYLDSRSLLDTEGVDNCEAPPFLRRKK